MKVLLINGSPRPQGCTFTALSEVAKQLNLQGIETQFFHIGNKAIHGCIACRGCIKTGYCVFDDGNVNECVDLLEKADGVVIGSPVYFAGPNGTLCAFLDRVFYCKSHKYAHKPGAAIVSCRRGGAASSFDRLNKYFTISNMPVVSSQYWNEIHGNTPEETLRDIEGMQIMRTLGNNMAWLLKCIELAKDRIPYPDREDWTPTNFIR